MEATNKESRAHLRGGAKQRRVLLMLSPHVDTYNKRNAFSMRSRNSNDGEGIKKEWVQDTV